MTTLSLDAVVKVGGALLARGPSALDAVSSALSAASRRHRILVVPGGGPFADAVRAVDAEFGLGDHAAHWMAVLGMEQYAHALAGRVDGATMVNGAEGVREALARGALPVLAPFRWLRDADPLPHSWTVTSDSIAAWVAGELTAPLLVLLKPSGAVGSGAVDEYFPRALRAGTECLIHPADRVSGLASLLDERRPARAGHARARRDRERGS